MTYTDEERAEFRRVTELEAARKAAALTPDEKATLLSLIRETSKSQGRMGPVEVKQLAGELLGRPLPGGELHALMMAQR